MLGTDNDNSRTDNLENMLRDETTGPDFAQLPFNYMEVSKILLETCVSPFLVMGSFVCSCGTAHSSRLWNDIVVQRRASDDIPNPERIRSLLKDLREVRQGKAREGLEHLNPVELNVRRSSGNATVAENEQRESGLFLF